MASFIKGEVVKGEACYHVQLLAAEVFPRASGYFFLIDSATGHAQKAVAADTVLTGWLDLGITEQDENTSNGVFTVPAASTKVYKTTAYSSGVFRLPMKSGETLAVTMGGLLCDLDVTSNVQSVTAAATSTQVVMILPPNENDIRLNAPRVIINPAKYGRS